MKIADVAVREYKRGDEYRITDLFMASSPHLRTSGFFRWANLQSPFPKSISLVMEDKNGMIVGHYSIMKMRVMFNNKAYNAGFGAQLVIHPKFRDFQLMWKLLTAVWDRCGENRIDFIYAFPNMNIWPIDCITFFRFRQYI